MIVDNQWLNRGYDRYPKFNIIWDANDKPTILLSDFRAYGVSQGMQIGQRTLVLPVSRTG
jgi:hypothetical protein